jgi:SAM-dependent methyltransferase
MHPLDDPGYSLRRYYVDEFLFRFVATLPRGSMVLDIGGTREKQRGRFRTDPFGLRVTTVNISGERHPDIVADAASLPIADGVFDAAICSEVLEHVPEPDRILREAHRVLRSGGKLFICVPFLHRIHADPEDYGRYTDTFWQRHLSASGFDVAYMERQGGYWAVLTEMLTMAASGRITACPTMVAALAPALGSIQELRKLAVEEDGQPAAVANELHRSYTTGFGIIGVKSAEVS